MNPSWIHAAIVASTALCAISACALIYDWIFRYRLALRGRLSQLLDAEHAHAAEAALFKDLSRSLQQDGHPSLTLRQRLQHLFSQAGIDWTEQGFVVRCLVSGLLGGCIGLLSHGWITAAVVGAIASLAPLCLLYSRRHHRMRLLCRQLPETFEMISRAVRAGQTVTAALQIIADDFDPPVSEEFARCAEQQNLGVSRESALKQLAIRANVMELQIFVVALLVQARSGGDLVELLDNLSTIVRKRLRMWERVRALTSEGRMQARVLMILPVAALAAVLLLAPDYAAPLLQRPELLLGSAFLQVLGMMWIRRIVNFEV